VVRQQLGRALAVAAMAVVGLGVAACGGGGDSGGGDATGAKRGGSITIGSVLPDSYDPVLFQTVQANQPLHLVYTGLLTYKDAEGPEGSKLVPGLAEAMPAI
jgi:peptide/nickel transport system substrate-binding protein